MTIYQRLRAVIHYKWTYRYGLPILVFLLALLPRVTSLTVFLTADEDDQLQFASQFLQAVLHKNWAGMLVLGYPGVPTMALGALGLWIRYWIVQLFPWGGASPLLPIVENPGPAYSHHVFLPFIAKNFNAGSAIEAMLTTVRQQPLDFIVAVRLPMVLTASIMITLAFILLRRLLPERMAFLAILLVACDPFFLANSRIIHVDAPLAYFMLTSFLAFLVYLKQGHWGWLVTSGVLGGLAVLSKTPAVLLAPILLVGGGAFVAAAPTDRAGLRRRWLVALGSWALIAGLAFFAFWPSLWTQPVFALMQIVQNAMVALNTPHPSSGLFWGKLVTDRSPWYYLVAFPFSLTPLTTIGMVVGGWLVVVGAKDLRRQKQSFATQQLPMTLALWAFIIIFLVVVSMVGRRGVRYLLPIFPVLDVLAAVALWTLVQAFSQRWGQVILTIVVLVQVGQVLSFHPYYFNYFNPLLGGSRTAPEYVVIGWGEGLDRAAAYLNQKPDAPRLRVAAWYSWQFAPYFVGNTVDLASNKPALTADYTVFYINQVQRRFPTAELLAYFADRQPEKVITLGGIDYAWIYPGPIIGRKMPDDVPQKLDRPLNMSLLLQGMDVSTFKNGALLVTLYWQPTAPLPPDLNVSLRLVDSAGQVWGQADRLPIGGLVRTDKWQPGDIIRDEYRLPVDPAIPPGDYHFDVQMYDFNTGAVFGQVKQVGQVTVTPPKELVSREEFEGWAESGQSSVVSYQSKELADGLTLLGGTFDDFETLPGYRKSFQLYWQAEKLLNPDYAVSLIARAVDGTEIPLATVPIGAENYPTSQWRRGEILGQTVTVRIPAATPPGNYTLLARVAGGGETALGMVSVRAQAHTFTLPADAHATAARFGTDQAIALAGYTLSTTTDALDLTLYWRADRIPTDDLKVFVHITNPAGEIVAQRDSIPASGTRSTLTWMVGEVIADSYRIPRKAGQHTVWVGLYNPLTGSRLPVSADLPVSDNRLQLAQPEVGQ